MRLGDDRFHAEVENGQFAVARGAADPPDAVLETDPATFRGLVFGGRPLADALRAGAVRLTGDRQSVARFVGCFPRPSLV